MRELGIVVVLVALMGIISAVWVTPWDALYYTGIWITLAGFAFGIPTGLLYHVRLHQALGPRGELPPGWYWNAIRLNSRLRPDERGKVMPWCYAGAFGFAVICIGLIMMGGGVSMALIRGV